MRYFAPSFLTQPDLQTLALLHSSPLKLFL